MANKIYVWDPLVRIFHWSLVVTFTLAYLTGEDNEWLHVNSGYVIAGLVVFRLFWGVIGTRTARFSDFVRPPSEALSYIKSLIQGNVRDYRGHNPAGGWMVIMLLVSLSLTTLSGMQLYAVDEGKGPLAISTQFITPAYASDDEQHEDDDENEGEEFWEEIHEFLANFTVLLIFLHISGVLVSSVRHRQNLVKAMIVGYKTEKD